MEIIMPDGSQMKKLPLEIALGASASGRRSLVLVKHVGDEPAF